MKRSPMPRKGKATRHYKTPRCMVRGCNKAELVAGLCESHAREEADRACRAQARLTITECSACGVTVGLQWSHHLSRKFMWIRYDPRNWTMHCAPCHATFTYNPALHHEWIVQHIGERTFAELMDLAYGPFDPNTGTRTGPPRFGKQDMANAYIVQMGMAA